MGFELGGAVAGGTLLGVWIDWTYGSGPWGVVIGFALGLIGGLYNMFRATLPSKKPSRAPGEARDDDQQ